MPSITKPVAREIIEDFAKEITARRLHTAKPSKTVINFRTDKRDGVERTIWRVPIELLRYRKDNGRITSDVLDYEKNVGILDERDDFSQANIAKFLEEKDPEKTSILRNSIMHGGQSEPAIITCDGFLINGNRRKMVMARLHREAPNDDIYAYMKAVILPGRDDEGGPPTLLEIEKIENRYQLQSDGKSEYYGFDRALSIKRKIQIGLSLEEQLSDDPQYAGATKTQIEKAIRDHEKNFLLPLECVDRYLKQFKREGQYRTISSGMSDREGRWQAFIDYSSIYTRYLSNPKRRIELNIEEDEIGGIEEAAFDIIRFRTIPDMPKVHMIMRNLPKYCRTKDGKKEILRIAEQVEPVLPPDELINPDRNPLLTSQIDAKWAAKTRETIIYRVKKAAHSHEVLKEKETPIGLLESALKKLTHDEMDLRAIATSDFGTARTLLIEIQDRAKELESEVYHFIKEFKKLGKKKG